MPRGGCETTAPSGEAYHEEISFNMALNIEPTHCRMVDPDVLEEIGKLRITAWEASGERPSFAPREGQTWIDSHDDHAEHWVLRTDGHLIAAARMCIHHDLASVPDSEALTGIDIPIPLPVASFNRLVASPSHRGSRLGPVFDRLRLEHARAKGAKAAIAVTHLNSRLRDLRSVGFTILGESPYRIVQSAPSFVALTEIGVGPDERRA